MKTPLAKRSVPAAADTGTSSVPALERGLAMMETLAHRPEGLTLSELTAALDLSPASAHRITGTLEDSGYLRRDEVSRRYTLTRKLLLCGPSFRRPAKPRSSAVLPKISA